MPFTWNILKLRPIHLVPLTSSYFPIIFLSSEPPNLTLHPGKIGPWLTSTFSTASLSLLFSAALSSCASRGRLHPPTRGIPVYPNSKTTLEYGNSEFPYLEVCCDEWKLGVYIVTRRGNQTRQWPKGTPCFPAMTTPILHTPRGSLMVAATDCSKGAPSGADSISSAVLTRSAWCGSPCQRRVEPQTSGGGCGISVGKRHKWKGRNKSHPYVVCFEYDLNLSALHRYFCMELNKGRHTGKITFGTFGTPCFRFHLESRGCMAETKSTNGEYTINGPKKTRYL